MYSQIVLDSDTCLNLLSFVCPAEGRDVPVLTDSSEEKEYCLLHFDNYGTYVCYMCINITFVLISKFSLNRNMQNRRL
jgi:hypothetical protein